MKQRMYAVSIGHYRMTHHGCNTYLFLARSKKHALTLSEDKVFSDDYVWDIRNVPLSKSGFVDVDAINREVQKTKDEEDIKERKACERRDR